MSGQEDGRTERGQVSMRRHEAKRVEQAVANEIRPAEKLLLRRSPENLQRAGQLLALHRVADGQRGDDHDGAVEIVPFAVARCVAGSVGREDVRELKANVTRGRVFARPASEPRAKAIIRACAA